MRRRFGAVKSERAAQAGSEEGPLGSDPGRSGPKRLGPKHVTFSKGSSPAGDAPAVLARVGLSTTPRAVVTSRQRGSRGSRPARGCVQYGNGARCARTVPALPETPREHFLAERRTQAARVAQSGGGPARRDPGSVGRRCDRSHTRDMAYVSGKMEGAGSRGSGVPILMGRLLLRSHGAPGASIPGRGTRWWDGRLPGTLPRARDRVRRPRAHEGRTTCSSPKVRSSSTLTTDRAR